MALILNCDKCGKRMHTLDPSIIADNKYLCKKCGDEVTGDKQTAKNVEGFYEGLDVNSIPWLGFWKRPEYDIFIKNGFKYISTVSIIRSGQSAGTYADQFDNSKYIILSLDTSWSVYDKTGKLYLNALPHVFNSFNAFNPIFIATVITKFI